MTKDEVDMLYEYEGDPEVGAVVVGFDKDFSYPKLLKAATYVQDPTVHFIGTNPDVEGPSPTSAKFPGLLHFKIFCNKCKITYLAHSLIFLWLYIYSTSYYKILEVKETNLRLHLLDLEFLIMILNSKSWLLLKIFQLLIFLMQLFVFIP